MGEKIRVLLADDHPLVRAGIRTILAGEPDVALVGEAADGDEARRLTLEIGPDVLVLDLSMPGPSARDTVLYLREHCPLTRVLILTAYDDEAYVRALVAAGVAGYVLKDEMPETIVRALRTVWKGDTWLSGALVQKLVRPGEAPIVEVPRFSRREVQILRLVLAGKTDRDIGRELGLAERTVRYALRSVYDKLGVDSRVEAAVRAAQLGLGEADL